MLHATAHRLQVFQLERGAGRAHYFRCTARVQVVHRSVRGLSTKIGGHTDNAKIPGGARDTLRCLLDLADPDGDHE